MCWPPAAGWEDTLTHSAVTGTPAITAPVAVLAAGVWHCTGAEWALRAFAMRSMTRWWPDRHRAGAGPLTGGALAFTWCSPNWLPMSPRTSPRGGGGG